FSHPVAGGFASMREAAGGRLSHWTPPKEYGLMRRARKFAAVTVALSLVLGTLVAGGRGQGGGKTVLPEAERNQLIAHDAKVIQDALAKGTIDTKPGRKLKATALMLAAYAQGALDGARAKEMATLRDTALKVLQALEDKKVPEAKNLAEALKPGG